MKLFAFLALVLCARSSWAFYSSSDDVFELTPSNLNKLVINDEAVWIVELFAPWCGHCQSLVSEYKKLAKAVKGKLVR